LSGHTEDASQPAQTGPFSLRLQHVPTACWLFCRFRHHYSIRSTVLAVLVRVARCIPTMLDDVFTATRAACVRHGYLNHAADYGSSLTLSPHPPDVSVQIMCRAASSVRSSSVECRGRLARLLSSFSSPANICSTFVERLSVSRQHAPQDNEYRSYVTRGSSSMRVV
jgi:hypothetical protein